MSVPALAGLRVLELSRLLPGSAATWYLADMGAEVIRVESPPIRERTRIEQMIDHVFNRNKKSVVIDLKQSAGQAVLADLARGSDALVIAYRPDVAARLGAGYDTLSAGNERLIYCSISAFGQTGPYQGLPGFDPAACALIGAAAATGDSQGLPTVFGIPVADIATGVHAAYGVMCALWARERTGRGQVIETSMLESMMPFMGMHAARLFITGRPTRRGVLSLAVPPPLRARDGYVVAVNEEPHLWRNFCAAIGLAHLSELQHVEQDRRPAILKEIEQVLSRFTRAELLELGLREDCVILPVLEIDEVMEDPQVRARELVTTLADGTGSSQSQLGLPVKLSDTPAEIRSRAPLPGEHTLSVLQEIGLSDEAILVLTAQGSVCTRGPEPQEN